MSDNLKPGNDPNVSPALSNAETVVEPVVDPVVDTVEPTKEPVQPVEPVVQPVVDTVEPVVESSEPAADPVQAVVEPVSIPPIETPESLGTFLESADAILKEAGFDTNAIMQTITAAGGEVTPEVQKLISGKLGEAQTNVLMQGLKQEILNVQTTQKEANAKIFDVVGGEETWQKIAEWTKTPEAGLSEEAKTDYNQMLAKGGVQAELAAKAIKEAYMASPGFVQEPNLLEGNEAAQAVTGIKAISRAQFVTEKKKAARENNAVAVADLDARAKYTMEHQAGLWRAASFQG